MMLVTFSDPLGNIPIGHLCPRVLQDLQVIEVQTVVFIGVADSPLIS